jgi:hypothetical protein
VEQVASGVTQLTRMVGKLSDRLQTLEYPAQSQGPFGQHLAALRDEFSAGLANVTAAMTLLSNRVAALEKQRFVVYINDFSLRLFCLCVFVFWLIFTRFSWLFSSSDAPSTHAVPSSKSLFPLQHAPVVVSRSSQPGGGFLPRIHFIIILILFCSSNTTLA